MALNSLELTRDQLATFLKNHEQIKQFERLFKVADEVSLDSDTLGAHIQAGSAEARAASALALLLEFISSSTSDVAIANQKANLAYDLFCQWLNQKDSSPIIGSDPFLVADYIDFNLAPHVNQLRRMAWNDTDKTIEIGLDHGVVQQIGLEWYARVGNTTGSVIPNGTVVGLVGATTDALLVAPYLANGTTSSLRIVGVMTHDLPDSGQKGYATVWGFVRGLDTSSFLPGDILYASTATPGAFTKVKPTAPNNVIPVAICVISDATSGVVFVRPNVELQKYYGVFAKTTSQSPASTNTAYPVTFDSSTLANGVLIGSPASRIVVPESGLYQINATVQLTSTTSSQKNIWVWFRKNGVDIPSSSRVVTSDLNNGYIPLTLVEPVSLNASDYIELVFASDSTAVTLGAVAATAFAPASPAVLLSITQIQQ